MNRLIFHCPGVFKFNFLTKLETQKAKFKSYQLLHTLYTLSFDFLNPMK